MVAPGYISGIGTLIDLAFAVVIAIRLYRPAKEDNFRYDTFRGAFFWSFVFFSIFFVFMSLTLFVSDAKTVGIWGYTFGHIFLYLMFSFNIFVPFSVTSVRKIVPRLLSLSLLGSGAYVTYVNWMAYLNEDTLPVFDSGVTIWNPPQLVSIYIPVVSAIVWILFGFLFFIYHALRTSETWLKRRSLLLGFGFLVITIGGPLHDQPLPGFYILIADVVTALGMLILSLGIFYPKPKN